MGATVASTGRVPTSAALPCARRQQRCRRCPGKCVVVAGPPPSTPAPPATAHHACTAAEAAAARPPNRVRVVPRVPEAHLRPARRGRGLYCGAGGRGGRGPPSLASRRSGRRRLHDGGHGEQDRRHEQPRHQTKPSPSSLAHSVLGYKDAQGQFYPIDADGAETRPGGASRPEVPSWQRAEPRPAGVQTNVQEPTVAYAQAPVEQARPRDPP